MIDEIFPQESGVRIIAEPGRYFVAAAATLVASVVAYRHNGTDKNFTPKPINDKEASQNIDNMTRKDGDIVVRQSLSFNVETEEAAVNGVVLQSLVDTNVPDDFVYYLNDGVYSAFNNIMFDHAVVRPRHLKNTMFEHSSEVVVKMRPDGMVQLEKPMECVEEDKNVQHLYASTVFGPTCDSIDVIARSVLLPKLKTGDWLYFQNMGAYTMAASSCFNGFDQSEIFYVCSVPLQYLEKVIVGSDPDDFFKDVDEFDVEEKKE